MTPEQFAAHWTAYAPNVTEIGGYQEHFRDLCALMGETEASEYVVPFEYVRQHVKPDRDKNNRKSYREKWWQHAEVRPAMRAAFQSLSRYVATPRVAKHRLFVWLPLETLPDSQIIAIAREDDFTLGVLHSHIHELWALRLGTALGVGNDPRYTPSTTFETFPFPRPTPEQHAEIGKWAKYLDGVRTQLLADDPRATLTGMYNALATLREHRDASHLTFALLVAHERLDAAVAAAYSWAWPLEDDEVLARLLALNLERAGATRTLPSRRHPHRFPGNRIR